ncbi:doublecortin domain-containing protein 2 [Ara ararauna]
MTSTGTKGSWLSQPTVKNLLVYRNGDPFFPGHRIVISEKKVSNFEVFLKEVTAGVKAPFGAVRNIYTPRGGHRVRQLEELRSGEQYVAGGREAFKKLNYLNIGETKKKPPEVNNEVKPVTHSRITVSARFRKPLQEPYTIFLIANGDLISPVVRLLIPRKTLNHWDHILEMVTGKVTIRSGAVHRLYTVDGKLVQNGSDLENGQIYVAAGREKFKKLPYGDLLFRKSMRRPQGSKASALPPIVGSRKSKGSGSDRQSKSTTGSSDPGENSSSPQFPRRKDKRSHNPEDSVSRQHFSDNSTEVKETVIVSTGAIQDNGGNIFKASGDGSEMWGAAEVQEDEDTHVEVPLDQRPAETVDEEENAEEENDCGEEVYKGEEEYPEVNGEEEYPEVNGEESEKTAKERSEAEENKKLNENYKDEAKETEEDSDSQNQVDSHLEKAPTAPRVTITSPQESEKKRPEQ